MKIKLLFIALFFVFHNSFCQDISQNESGDGKVEESEGMENNPDVGKVEESENKKINFVVGVGPRYALGKIYKDPYVNLTNNFVVIEEARKLSSNLSFGIVYTPYLYKIKNLEEEYFIYKGISFSTFISPSTLGTFSSDSNNAFFDYVDFGFGMGWKFASGIMILGTLEFATLRQMNDSFVSDYKGNDLQYVIDGDIQKSFNSDDKSIFHNRLLPTLGVKVCYTFDIVKSFKNESKPE